MGEIHLDARTPKLVSDGFQKMNTQDNRHILCGRHQPERPWHEMGVFLLLKLVLCIVVGLRLLQNSVVFWKAIPPVVSHAVVGIFSCLAPFLRSLESSWASFTTSPRTGEDAGLIFPLFSLLNYQCVVHSVFLSISSFCRASSAGSCQSWPRCRSCCQCGAGRGQCRATWRRLSATPPHWPS